MTSMINANVYCGFLRVASSTVEYTSPLFSVFPLRCHRRTIRHRAFIFARSSGAHRADPPKNRCHIEGNLEITRATLTISSSSDENRSIALLQSLRTLGNFYSFGVPFLTQLPLRLNDLRKGNTFSTIYYRLLYK